MCTLHRPSSESKFHIFRFLRLEKRTGGEGAIGQTKRSHDLRCEFLHGLVITVSANGDIDRWKAAAKHRANTANDWMRQRLNTKVLTRRWHVTHRIRPNYITSPNYLESGHPPFFHGRLLRCSTRSHFYGFHTC